MKDTQEALLSDRLEPVSWMVMANLFVRQPIFTRIAPVHQVKIVGLKLR